jgi:hypothetical protein
MTPPSSLTFIQIDRTEQRFRQILWGTMNFKASDFWATIFKEGVDSPALLRALRNILRETIQFHYSRPI